MFDFINHWNWDATPTYVGAFYLFSIASVLLINRQDPKRIWIAAVIFLGVAIDFFVFRTVLPRGVIIHQIAYSIMDLTIIILLKKRLAVCEYALKVINANTSSFAHKILTDKGSTKQEIFIRNMFKASIFVNLLMIVEHCIRHPEFFGMAENKELAQSFVYLFYAYPSIQMAINSLIGLALFTMTVDGIFSKRNSIKSY